jgi:phosphoglycerol transferase MdoB-like AlkP superfamily enzyme
LKNTILLQARYYFFWILFFLLARAIFIVYHLKAFAPIPLKTILLTFFHGLSLDLSAAGYLSILPFLLFSLTSLFSHPSFFKIIRIYTLILSISLAFVVTADSELFTAWGFRMDNTVIRYLLTPAEALASALSSPLLVLMIIWILTATGSWFLFKKLFPDTRPDRNIPAGLLGILTTAALILPVRGGLQLVPINESTAYFSSNDLANQTALNVFWNFSHSLIETYDDRNPYLFYPEDKAEKLTRSLYLPADCRYKSVLKTATPNVLLIIWESFTAKTLLPYYGKTIIPHFQRYIKEGIYFNNLYASGDRSDKGLVAILSGYPSSPVKSIINNPSKSAKLQCLGTDLKNKGYANSFYYGGEPEFANIKTFLFHHNIYRIISKQDFDKSSWNSKWGAHDGEVFERLYKDLNHQHPPFFTTLFTLSSHEPFEIPMAPLLPPDSRDHLFLNAHHYTDQCLGNFLDKAKNTKWWDNTLIIIVADHGHALPGGAFADHGPEDFKVPMLWLGGALNIKDTVISTLGSQTDIARTLTSQLNIENPAYRFSKNMFCRKAKPFAFYAFNNGFGYLEDSSAVLYHNLSGTIGYQKGDSSILSNGKAYLQSIAEDYLNK